MKPKTRFSLIFTGLILFIFMSVNSFTQEPWSQGADMPTARLTYATGTVNGKIYVVGGGTETGPTNILEEYDPATDTWATKAPMSSTRQDLSGCDANGKIYAIGGWRSFNFTFSKIEEYDPATDTWSTKTPMPTARWGHASCSVNGKIYVISGAKGWPLEIMYESTLVYDPLTDTWETKASIPTPRWIASCCVLDGKIYVIGGTSETGVVPTVEVYDPATDTWTSKPQMPTARWGLATATVNSKIYAIGGGYPYPAINAYKIAEEYDPVTDTWATKSSMPAGRLGITACSVNGKIYVPGGIELQASEPYNELYIYNPENELGIDNNTALNFRFYQNYPNPFSTSTTIEYEHKQPEKVSMTIYNHLGQLVYQTQKNQPQGKQQLIWNAEGYADGIYYYRLQAGDQIANGKIVKVR